MSRSQLDPIQEPLQNSNLTVTSKMLEIANQYSQVAEQHVDEIQQNVDHQQLINQDPQLEQMDNLQKSEVPIDPMELTDQDIPNAEQSQRSGFQFQQVQTENTAPHQRTITPPQDRYDEEINNKINTIQIIDKHKMVLKSPRPSETKDDPYQLKVPIRQPEQATSRVVIKKQYPKVEKMNKAVLEQNMREIYLFYAKQGQMTGKQSTFDQLYQQSNTMTLQKFMFFCRDFRLLELEVTNELLKGLGGQIVKRRPSKIGKQRDNMFITKPLLVEWFKKCSTLQELSFTEFNQLLQKLGEVVFSVEEPVEIFFKYLEFEQPQLYRKKMVIVGKPFNTKEQTEVITQEKLYARRIVLPPKNRAVSVRQDVSLPQIHQKTVPNEKPRNKFVDLSQDRIRWDDLNNTKQIDFNPKELLLEQDISDQEDDLYLGEYNIKEPVIQSTNMILRIPDRLDTVLQQQQQQVSSKRYSNMRKKVKDADSGKDQREKLIYETFMRNQQNKELRMGNRK